jgi:hypothetical protein
MLRHIKQINPRLVFNPIGRPQRRYPGIMVNTKSVAELQAGPTVNIYPHGKFGNAYMIGNIQYTEEQLES